ncbi:hypothetical protein D3C80_1532050 [compost metagenome]
MVIMAFHKVHTLLRLVSKIPCRLAVCYSTGDPCLHGLFKTTFAADKSRLLKPEDVALHRIAEAVVKMSDARQHIRIALGGQPRRGKLRVHNPALADRQERRIDLIQPAADFLHCPDINQSHQIKAESVDMILPGPIQDGLYNKTGHHQPLAGDIIAAA